MRIGVMFDTEIPFDEMVGQVASLRDAGIQTAWASQIFGYDALTALAAIGREVPGHRSGHRGGSHLPAPPGDAGRAGPDRAGRHRRPADPGHRPVPPGGHRERVRPVVRQAGPAHAGVPVDPGAPARGRAGVLRRRDPQASTFGPLQIDAPAPPVLVAALGTTMLRIAGADGLGHGHLDDRARHLEAHVIPTIREAAAEAGRPVPRIGVGLPVCVTDDVDAARAKAAEVFAIYGHLPSYRAMLDREGRRRSRRCGHRRLRVRGQGSGSPSGRHRHHRLLRCALRIRRTRSRLDRGLAESIGPESRPATGGPGPDARHRSGRSALASRRVCLNSLRSG